jgi:hypothetical protein
MVTTLLHLLLTRKDLRVLSLLSIFNIFLITSRTGSSMHKSSTWLFQQCTNTTAVKHISSSESINRLFSSAIRISKMLCSFCPLPEKRNIWRCEKRDLTLFSSSSVTSNLHVRPTTQMGAWNTM